MKKYIDLKNQKNNIVRFKRVWVDFEENLTYNINKTNTYEYADVINQNGEVIRTILWGVDHEI